MVNQLKNSLTIGVFGVHICAVRKENSHNFCFPFTRCSHERRFTIFVIWYVYITSMLYNQTDGTDVMTFNRIY